MPWLPSDIKKTVVMIGENLEEGIVRSTGSGVLINYQGVNYVVSAGHVIRRLNDPVIIFNDKKGSPIGRTTSVLSDRFGVNWEYHVDDRVDLAAIPFGIDPKTDDILTLGEGLFQDFTGINDGEDVFFMGFPLSLSRRDTIIPVIRQGCVALKFDSETIINRVRYPQFTFLVDGQVSSGNSGSPVYMKPTFIDIQRRSIGGYHPPTLFGIVTSHIASVIKDLNNRPIARENSGLGIISSTNRLIELLDSINHSNL